MAPTRVSRCSRSFCAPVCSTAISPILGKSSTKLYSASRAFARVRAKARDALYNFVEDFPKIGEMAVLHTGAQNDLEHLLTRVGAIYPRERVAVLQPGPTVTCWLGR